ncbi:MAG TPA: 50S ribosomal protein L29 [Candidatus Babeliales bacterium]|nr:50S ribosomal protein L29 [Candidatus Babeliales bacterium]
MKVDAVKGELKSAEIKKTEELLEQWRKELFGLRMNSLTSHVKDYSLFKKLRQNIARALTFLQQKKSAKEVL